MRRNPPDLRKLSRAVIAMALREAEAAAEAKEAMNAVTTEPAPPGPRPTTGSATPEDSE
ncbi:hypothetical protein M879_21645 [Mycobacteroides abscessus V06705]|nr:hypothetical protein M879_21645 [Mycobacteroides abscessus V06705]